MSGERDVNVACVDLDFCTKPVAHNESETIDMQTYVINLDLAPEERWTEICSNETYIAHWKDMVNWITGGLADGGKVGGSGSCACVPVWLSCVSVCPCSPRKDICCYLR